jgi:SAM-dependent methyltransferase
MTTPPAIERAPHAALDPTGRWPKAIKIQRLLGLEPGSPGRLSLLEVGTGSGAIAHYFAQRSGLDCDVDAVDVVDQRTVIDGYRFEVIRDTALPYLDGRFDVVISNHVIEHVGDKLAQLAHLREIRRVLRDSGVAYLAVPNRWQIVEPHFRLAFLSWLPRRWRDAYVRAAGKGNRYDCEPLTVADLESLLIDADFAFRNVCVEAMHETFAIERPEALLARIVGCVPRSTLQRLRRLIPTLIYVLRKPAPQ